MENVLELEDVIALMRRILWIAVGCMEYEDLPDWAAVELAGMAPKTLRENLLHMMARGGLIECGPSGTILVTLDGLEWLERHPVPERDERI